MAANYKVHPAIGIARVGNSPTDFYLSPEDAGGLPIACDQGGNPVVSQGQEQRTSDMKDPQGRIKRQGARFRVFVYDDKNPEGRELRIGDAVEGVDSRGKLVDIEWTVYLANKKASWYQFKELEGEHGYAPGHPLRNADITGAAARAQLMIDPGTQTVSGRKRTAALARGANPAQAQTFPPPLSPCSIDTLGELKVNDEHQLVVLGGFGNSGSWKAGEFGQPRIDSFANNDGWFDDVSDGPVTARLRYWDEEDGEHRYIEVQDPSWVIVGQPSYAPPLLNMVTLDDVLFDLSVREFGSEPYLYGPGPYGPEAKIDPTDPEQLKRWRLAKKRFNPDYYPYFYKEILPILQRPTDMQWVTDFLVISSDPHQLGARGNFDVSVISVPPKAGDDPKLTTDRAARREYVYAALRRPGEENVFQSERMRGAPLMPLLCGDNPLSNVVASKFLRLTDTQLFLLEQWMKGKFINEKLEPINSSQVEPEGPGVAIDRGVLSNILGGAFCPGGEVGWIIRNPAIYSKPYRIKPHPDYVPSTGSSRPAGDAEFLPPALSLTEDLSQGLEPGDITKRSALPWQADFNECSTQNIDVTYAQWNQLYPEQDGDAVTKARQRTNPTLWWPAHRPMQVYVPRQTGPEQYKYSQLDWARGIPQTPAGDLKMVTAWKELGFVLLNPRETDQGSAKYIELYGPPAGS